MNLTPTARRNLACGRGCGKGEPQNSLLATLTEKLTPCATVNAMLLNEFLKEHPKNEQQEATITLLRKQVEVLTVGLQKVSAQLELSKPAPQTPSNNH
jgi:hypothetical protein